MTDPTPTYYAGDTVIIQACITNADCSPGTPTSVTVNIYDPFSNLVVSSGTMSQIGPAGTYIYLFQTNPFDLGVSEGSTPGTYLYYVSSVNTDGTQNVSLKDMFIVTR
jgi:hypothetical protein